MILLELTEKELEVLRAGLIKEKLSWEGKDISEFSRATIENKLAACYLAEAKMDIAIEPKEEVLITFKDLFYIISKTNDEFRNLPADMHITSKKIEECDFVHIALANTIIMWLNSKNLLKQVAKFDYTDQSAQYEEMD